jgi:transcriptional regulator with PAS, ATPase and Fis domain
MPDDTQTDTVHDAKLASLQVRGVSLEVRTGPDAGLRMRVESPRFVVGSGESADLVIADKTVSREHVTLTLGPTGVTVRDESSRNGTFLGSIRVREVLLSADALLRIGNTTLAVAIDAGLSDIPVATADRFGDALGVSAAMRHVFALLGRAAATDVTVLLEGESGVGKEVLARAVHAESPRVGHPFVAVDCGAIPATLIESELFGHARGAFTGATHNRVGLFEEAEGGTIFLDEIGELPVDLQPKLLRVLEQREVRPVGGRDLRPLNVRVVAATNRNLASCVAQGTFRKDLYYRLSVARVVVPPLRDRTEDIEPLATALLQKTLGDPGAQLAPDIAALLRAYRWPGNVRELKNVVDRHALLGVRDEHQLFDGGDAPRRVFRGDVWTLPLSDARRAVLDEFEREYVTRLLADTNGVIVRAADRAGVSRPTLYRVLDRLGIDGGKEGDE